MSVPGRLEELLAILQAKIMRDAYRGRVFGLDEYRRTRDADRTTD